MHISRPTLVKYAGFDAERCLLAGCVENAADEIAAMANFPNMRLYQNGDGGSKTPLAESANSGWKLPAEMGGSFSAMCWFFGACCWHLGGGGAGVAGSVGTGWWWCMARGGGVCEFHWWLLL
jgi:hypothetical protein